MAHDAILAKGLKPLSSASFSRIIMTTAAPSFNPEALPAVTVPCFENAGRNFCRASRVVPFRIYSSSSTSNSDFFIRVEIGVISSLKLPRYFAFSALFCDFTENKS